MCGNVADLSELALNIRTASLAGPLTLPFRLVKLNLGNKFTSADAHLLTAIAGSSRHSLTSLSLGVTGERLSATLDLLAPCAGNLRTLSVANTSAGDHAPLSVFLRGCTQLEGLGAYALSPEMVDVMPAGVQRLSFSPFTLAAAERTDHILAPLLGRLKLLQVRVKNRDDFVHFKGAEELLEACEAAGLRVEYGFNLGF